MLHCIPETVERAVPGMVRQRYTFRIVSTRAGELLTHGHSWDTERKARNAGERYLLRHKLPYADCFFEVVGS